MMSTAVREYLRKQGIKLEEDALTSIALEGEGKIEDRVNRCAFSSFFVDIVFRACTGFTSTSKQSSSGSKIYERPISSSSRLTRKARSSRLSFSLV